MLTGVISIFLFKTPNTLTFQTHPFSSTTLSSTFLLSRFVKCPPPDFFLSYFFRYILSFISGIDYTKQTHAFHKRCPHTPQSRFFLQQFPISKFTTFLPRPTVHSLLIQNLKGPGDPPPLSGEGESTDLKQKPHTSIFPPQPHLPIFAVFRPPTNSLIHLDLDLDVDLHVENVNVVINYELPNSRELYLDHIGYSDRYARKAPVIVGRTDFVPDSSQQLRTLKLSRKKISESFFVTLIFLNPS